MKTIKIFTALLVLLFSMSCSKSSNDEINDQDVVFEGVWELRNITNFSLDGDTIPVEVSQDITAFVELIVSEGCEIMTFEFKADKSMILEQYNVTDYNPTTEEVEYVVNCENIDKFNGTWDLQDNTLNITGQDGEYNSFSVKFESGTMILENVPLGAILPVDGNGNFVFHKLGNG